MSQAKVCYKKDIFGNCIYTDKPVFRQNPYSQHPSAQVPSDNTPQNRNIEDADNVRGSTVAMRPKVKFQTIMNRS